jgi:hypothetical protein
VVELVLCFLGGKAEIVAGQQRVKAGKEVFIVSKGGNRGIKALTDLTVLHVAHPPPSEQDHQKVYAGLDWGKFD